MNRQVLDLSPHLNKEVVVKFQGGREVTGVLRGYDQLVNLVLEDAVDDASIRSSASSANPSNPGHEKQMNRQVLDLTPHLNKEVVVKFQGGREVTGVLRGYDQLVNLVLEDAVESFGEDTTKTLRKLGKVVCRGNLVSVVCPKDGFEEIQNPFLQSDE